MPSYSINHLVRTALTAKNAIGALGHAEHASFLETQVYIGLNDAETRKQEFETDRYVSILKRVCVEYGVPFSFDVINGGYIHDDGEFTEENTIMLTFIDVQEETVDEIAKSLCTLFHQESVLVTTDRIKVRSVRGVSAD